MKEIVNYIFEKLSDKYEKILSDMMTNGEINDDNIDKIINKIKTINTKNKFNDNKFINYYIKVKLYGIKGKKAKSDDNLDHYIYHLLCKYNNKDEQALISFIKPIETFYNNTAKRKGAAIKLYNKSNDENKFSDFMEYIWSEKENDKNIADHIFDLNSKKYCPQQYNSNNISYNNIYDNLTDINDKKELFKKLAVIKKSGIGNFEILFQIFFYNIIKPNNGDIGVIKKGHKDLDIIEFKSDSFALKSNGVDANCVMAYKEFFNLVDKDWENFIKLIKDENIVSPLSNKTIFTKTNNIFNEYINNQSNKDKLIKLYKTAFNNVFNKRILNDKNNIDFFEKININKLLANDNDEINKFNLMMCVCDLYNLIKTHQLIMIFDNADNGNYIFVDFSKFSNDIYELYNFLNLDNDFKFKTTSAWWSIKGREQGLVSNLQLVIK